MEKQYSILGALWRFFTFYKLRKWLGLVRAANKQFTESVSGISDAFDIHQQELIRQFNGLRDAVSQVEAVLEQKKQRLNDLNNEEVGVMKQRDGAIAAAERAKAASDDVEYQKHAAAFTRFQTRIDDIESSQTRLESEITELSKSMEKHLLNLTEMQATVQKLPSEKAEAIAEFVSAKQIIALNDRLNNLQSSIDSGPIDVVRQANRELSAKARISEKLSGTDVKLQDQQYEKEGQKAKAVASLEKILAARSAEKEQPSGAVTAPKEERKL